MYSTYFEHASFRLHDQLGAFLAILILTMLLVLYRLSLRQFYYEIFGMSPKLRFRIVFSVLIVVLFLNILIGFSGLQRSIKISNSHILVFEGNIKIFESIKNQKGVVTGAFMVNEVKFECTLANRDACFVYRKDKINTLKNGQIVRISYLAEEKYNLLLKLEIQSEQKNF